MALVKGSGTVLLVRPRPWTQEERDRLIQLLDRRGKARYTLAIDPLDTLSLTLRPLWRFKGSVMTDDRPFVETLDRVKSTVMSILRGQSNYRVDYIPVVYRSILSQFFYVILIGVILLLVPWFRWRRKHRGIPVAIPLSYIACLGYGYLAVEIILIQRLVLFIGHPTYAMTTVVFSMLLFSGLGSIYSGKAAQGKESTFLRRALIGSVVAIIAIGFFVPPLLLTYAHGAHPYTRALISLAAIAPVAFLMGMPFPVGLRYLTRDQHDLIPWAWAVNGWMSIVAGLFTVIVSRLFGYSISLVIGILAYVAAFMIARLFSHDRSPGV